MLAAPLGSISFRHCLQSRLFEEELQELMKATHSFGDQVRPCACLSSCHATDNEILDNGFSGGRPSPAPVPESFSIFARKSPDDQTWSCGVFSSCQTDQKEGFDVHIPELPQVEFGGKSDLSIAPSAACSRPIPEGFNLPKTELFWTNQRGHKLHIRHFEHENPLALVVLIHGYGAHMNSPHVYQTSCLYAKSLEAEIMTFDMQGHGYSEGPRGAVASFDDMAEDVESFMRLIYTAREAKGQDFHLCPLDALQRMQKLPFVLGGESMGAAVVLLAGLRLQVKPIPNGCFGGAVLLGCC